MGNQESYHRKKLMRSAEEDGISPLLHIILFSMITNQIKMKVVFDAAEEYDEISLNKTC